jgi:hypothetical protein
VADAPYDFELVPAASARRGLEGSVVQRVATRKAWKAMLTEMLQLCNEAAWRAVRKERAASGALAAAPPPQQLQQQDQQQASQNGSVLQQQQQQQQQQLAAQSAEPARQAAGGQEAKPLLLEFILDRVDTDDPLFGYVVRSEAQGWMQGFVTVTTFTTWQPWFRWDSGCALSGICGDDWFHRRCDASGALAAGLEATPRFGDPDVEGVIWSKVAEISLLGGLGCGGAVLRGVLDELTAESEYEYVVLQATDSSVPFYEAMGFVRVGGMACYAPVAEIEARQASKGAGEKNVPGVSSGAHPSTAQPTVRPPARLRVPKHEDDRHMLVPRMYWLHKALRDALKQLRALDYLLAFQEPVDTTTLWDYTAKVKRPLCFTDMLAFVQTGRYECFTQFEADFATVCENGMTYNPPGTQWHDCAEVMLAQGRVILDRWRRALPAYIRRGMAGGGTAGTAQRHDAPARRGVKAAVMGNVAYVAEAYRDPDVLGYCHWTFPDQLCEDQFPSIMMAKRLRPPPQPLQTMLSTAARDRALAASPGDGVVQRGRRFAAKHSTSAGHNYYLGIFDEAGEAENAVYDSRMEHSDPLPAGGHALALAVQQQQAPELGQQLGQQGKRPAPAPGESIALLRRRLVAAPRPAMALRGAEALNAAGDVRFDVLDARTAAHIAQHSAPVPAGPCANGVAGNGATGAQTVPEPEPEETLSPQVKLVVRHTIGRPVGGRRPASLYNKVVEVDGLPPCYPFKYWFVYHYIPDMQWCHLLPIDQVGTFDAATARSALERIGRPRWQCVPEGQQREIDVTASRCQPVRAIQCVRSESADEEVWDIVPKDEEEAYNVAQARRKAEQRTRREGHALHISQGGAKRARQNGASAGGASTSGYDAAAALGPPPLLVGFVPMSKTEPVSLTGGRTALMRGGQTARSADAARPGEASGADATAAAMAPQRRMNLKERMMELARNGAAFEFVLSTFGVQD